MPNPTQSAEQVKARLRRQGVTITQWAKQRGYSRTEVYRVLGGLVKGHYGRAHQIAVELGLKDPGVDANTATSRHLRASA